ncbi:cobalamin B12-binding domain-containing protein [Isachenkonia alkalipeptolytica]|uniref:Cobalamin-binding protein n=1 Tax=Isachenkonia alkalipeptolytica TaxID=2565777 RepID=A0AA44BDD0_9CLOT|nr:cobalamin-dependent protein [Isachenkonia alkalipeptolytica]NBG87778.1 cobalamin-binding protein [Isachenkonia alkalipeptolytica]
MSLLMNYADERFVEIAQKVFTEQFKRDPQLEDEMDERRKKLMYDDVVYNISYLMTAVYFKDQKIFEGYAIWIYELLCNLMKDLDRDRIMTQMNDHYRILSEILNQEGEALLSEEEQETATAYLNLAIEVTEKAETKIRYSTQFKEGAHYEIRKMYLEALMRNETREAHRVIIEAREEGVPLVEIYDTILGKTMHEVGELWHRHVITVDKEHYMTAVTQAVMASFYSEIFSQPRKNKRMVSCAVGSELHELGIRMLSDLFEEKGWDTYYLGAALPEESILHAIGEHEPQLLALSVTMPLHLPVCERIVARIKETYPKVKIAVGGHAFINTNELWKRWGIDYYSTTGRELIDWAEEEFQ